MNPMNQEQSEIANSLGRKYQLLEAAFTDLACDAAQFHSALLVHDMPSRDLSTALSRIVAVSEQLHVGLSRLRQDVLAVEAALAGPEDAAWANHIEGWLEAWLAHGSVANSRLH
ncbi:MAG TPA: hypothetical protein VFD98_12815 [Terracidiphilus sp.]|jgi:hypothetical protein|nr:hypothetical protein [Terracidiphilus sp.]